MASKIPERLVLVPRDGLSATSPRARRWLLAGAIVLILVTLGATAAALLLAYPEALESGPGDWRQVLGEAGRKLGEDPERAILGIASLVLSGLGLGVGTWRARRHRLVLTREGISLESHARRSRRPPKRIWALRWEQIRAVRLNRPWLGHLPMAVPLDLLTRGKRRRIYPAQWVDPQRFVPERWSLRVRSPDPREILAEVEKTPLLRYLAALGLPIEKGGAERPVGARFDLASNRHTLAALAILVALLGYALVDGLAYPETYAGAAPLLAMAAGGGAAALLAVLWLRSVKIPNAEAWSLGLLLGAALAGALYPGLLRINEWTDRDGLRPYPYQMTRVGMFEPLDLGPPAVRFTADRVYWSQFERGTVHELWLRFGGLRFYQLDLEPIRERMRSFYRRQRRADSASPGPRGGAAGSADG